MLLKNLKVYQENILSRSHYPRLLWFANQADRILIFLTALIQARLSQIYLITFTISNQFFMPYLNLLPQTP